MKSPESATSPDPHEVAHFAAWLRAVIERHAPESGAWLVEVHLQGRKRPIRQLIGRPHGLSERQLSMLGVLRLSARPLRGKEIAARAGLEFNGNFREELAQIGFMGLTKWCAGGYILAPDETLV